MPGSHPEICLFQLCNLWCMYGSKILLQDIITPPLLYTSFIEKLSRDFSSTSVPHKIHTARGRQIPYKASGLSLYVTILAIFDKPGRHHSQRVSEMYLVEGFDGYVMV